MRVLVACEFSGVVRNAFLARGYDAYSCDLDPGWLPPYDRHVRGDVRPLLREPWDLVIAHPPCTFLCRANAQFIYRPGRLRGMDLGVRFFLECLNANAPRVCVENPVPLRRVTEQVGRYNQIVHPWQFGTGVNKETALWLNNLPPLIPTRVVVSVGNPIRKLGSGKGRLRSVFFPCVAEAMADQWGGLPVAGGLFG
jgi:hypothetical protein